MHPICEIFMLQDIFVYKVKENLPLDGSLPFCQGKIVCILPILGTDFQIFTSYFITLFEGKSHVEVSQSLKQTHIH